MKGDEKSVDFHGIITCAKRFVDSMIFTAIKEITEFDDTIVDDKSPSYDPNDVRTRSKFDWVTSQNISSCCGLRCVKELMKKWNTESAMLEWKFYIEFIGLESDDTSNVYKYQVRWSVPTPAYPVPQVTVSVFFSVRASRKNTLDSPVDVTYTFEGNQFAHHLKMPFKPKWIYDVFDLKTIMFKSFTF